MVNASSKRRRYLALGSILLVLLMGGTYLIGSLLGTSEPTPSQTWTTVPVAQGSIETTVAATGRVIASRRTELNFTSNGQVAEVLVQPGDTVKKEQVLARMDTTELQSKLDRAKIDLQRAQAEYQKQAESAGPKAVADAQTQLESAQAAYQQTLGEVTPADIAAARAELERTQLALTQLETGPKDEQLRSVQANLQEAEHTLQSQRNSLSTAKTDAKNALSRSVHELTSVQAAYAKAKADWEFVQRTGKDPENPDTKNPETGTKEANRVTRGQRENYYQAFVSAETNLRNAEIAVTDAQVAYDTARQTEVIGVEEAEQNRQRAQAALDDTLGPADEDVLASARAEVHRAEAQLAKLTGAQRAGVIKQAEINVTTAQTALNSLMTAQASDVTISKAAVQVAEVAVKEIEQEFAQMELRAPFAGTIVQVHLQTNNTTKSTSTGESTSDSSSDSSSDADSHTQSDSSKNSSSSNSTGSGIVLMDLTRFQVDVPVDELDVAQVQPGQVVRITFDALPEAKITGETQKIVPVATRNQRGATTYATTVIFDAEGASVLPGMTASVQFVTEAKSNTLLVPRLAVEVVDDQSVVYVPTTGEPDPVTGRPASEMRPVTIGLSNETSIEITDGVEAGESVLVPESQPSAPEMTF